MKKLISLFLLLILAAFVTGYTFAADNSRDVNQSQGMKQSDRAPSAADRSDKAQLQEFLAQPDRYSDIYKTEVLSSDNHRVGKFEDFIVDRNGKISHLILAHGGLLGIGEKMIPIPWDFVSKNAKFDPNKKEFVLNITRDKLRNAPNFEQKNLPNFASGQFGRQVDDYFAKADTQAGRTMTETR